MKSIMNYFKPKPKEPEPPRAGRPPGPVVERRGRPSKQPQEAGVEEVELPSSTAASAEGDDDEDIDEERTKRPRTNWAVGENAAKLAVAVKDWDAR